MGAGSVAVCKRCFDNPLSEDERAASESTGKLTRKARLARKPPDRKKDEKKKLAKGKSETAKAVPAAGSKALASVRTRARGIRFGYSQKMALKYVALVLLLAATGALVTLSLLHKNPFGVVREKLDPQAQQKQLKGFVRLAVSRIEFYRQENGRLPATLKEVGITDTVVYKYQVISAEQYVVDATLNGQSFTYNSNQSAQQVFGGP